MAATTTLFEPFVQSLLSSGSPDFTLPPSLYLLLLTEDWTPDATLETRDQLTNELTASAEYFVGGNPLQNVTGGWDAMGFAYVDADDVLWPALSQDFRYAVLYQAIGTPEEDILLAFIDLGANQEMGGGAFIVQWAAPADGGVLRFGN